MIMISNHRQRQRPPGLGGSERGLSLWLIVLFRLFWILLLLLLLFLLYFIIFSIIIIHIIHIMSAAWARIMAQQTPTQKNNTSPRDFERRRERETTWFSIQLHMNFWWHFKWILVRFRWTSGDILVNSCEIPVKFWWTSGETLEERAKQPESHKKPSLNVKVMKFKQARVNGRSKYDSLKVAKCPVI